MTNLKASAVLALVLTVASPNAFAGRQPGTEWKDAPRDDRETVIARVIRNVRQLLTRALDTPTMPPPNH
jgi:hypothetical protein